LLLSPFALLFIYTSITPAARKGERKRGPRGEEKRIFGLARLLLAQNFSPPCSEQSAGEKGERLSRRKKKKKQANGEGQTCILISPFSAPSEPREEGGEGDDEGPCPVITVLATSLRPLI